MARSVPHPLDKFSGNPANLVENLGCNSIPLQLLLMPRYSQRLGALDADMFSKATNLLRRRFPKCGSALTAAVTSGRRTRESTTFWQNYRCLLHTPLLIGARGSLGKIWNQARMVVLKLGDKVLSCVVFALLPRSKCFQVQTRLLQLIPHPPDTVLYARSCAVHHAEHSFMHRSTEGCHAGAAWQFVC